MNKKHKIGTITNGNLKIKNTDVKNCVLVAQKIRGNKHVKIKIGNYSCEISNERKKSYLCNGRFNKLYQDYVYLQYYSKNETIFEGKVEIYAIEIDNENNLYKELGFHYVPKSELSKYFFFDEYEYIKEWNGGYVYGSVEELFGELFGLCGCGLPSKSIDYIYSALKFIQINRDRNDYYELLSNFFGKNEGLELTILYMLDERGVLEHGSSIYSAWVSDLGKAFIHDYQLYYESKMR